jgi:hypothetical protein
VYYKNTINEPLINSNTSIKIEKGDTYYSLSNKLYLNGNILKIYLKLNPPKTDLKA